MVISRVTSVTADKPNSIVLLPPVQNKVNSPACLCLLVRSKQDNICEYAFPH